MSTAALETFIKKYQTARSYNSKEIRLTIAEAEELSTAIALVLARTNVLSAKVIDLQDQMLQDRQVVEASGGSFT